MERGVMIFILFSGMTITGSFLSRKYHFVKNKKTWSEAQSYCRQNYKDLATIDNSEDMKRLISVKGNFTGNAWIGLYDDLNSWKWSLEDPDFYGPGQTVYKYWNSNYSEPNNHGGQEYCVQFSPSTYTDPLIWNDMTCSAVFSFICYNGDAFSSQTYVLVKTQRNWTDAQSYCRAHYTDLVSIRNELENQNVNTLAGSNGAWIGLYRTKLWSDGSNSTFAFWSPGKPNRTGASCVAVQTGHSGNWTAESCNMILPFFCYSALTTRPQLNPPTTILNRTALLPTNYIVRLRAKLASSSPLTSQNITDAVEKIKEQLTRSGLPADVIQTLRTIEANSTHL